MKTGRCEHCDNPNPRPNELAFGTFWHPNCLTEFMLDVDAWQHSRFPAMIEDESIAFLASKTLNEMNQEERTRRRFNHE